MKHVRFIFPLVLVLGIYIPIMGQNQNYLIEMDSACVVNNAGAIRMVNGISQYVMMPLQYNTNPNNGSLSLVIFEPLSGYKTMRSFSTSLNGLIVNEIVIGSNNEIYFFGQQNGVSVTGKINAAGNSVDWVYKDTSTINNMAACVFDYNNSIRIFETKQRANGNAALMYWNGTSVSSRREYSSQFIKDISLSLNASSIANSYISSIGKCSDTVLNIMTCRANGTQSSNYLKNYTLPTHWKWHEGGGSLTNISPDCYVAAIDVRCDTVEVDAVLLIKFHAAGSNISILDSKMIVFPAPKVIVSDIAFINEPFDGDVSLNILGHFIDTSDPFSYNGYPFCIKIDTIFNSYDILSYAVFFQDYHRRNFHLQKGCYDSNNLQFITSGSYKAYGATYPKGGIYVVSNSIGSMWLENPVCEGTININDFSASLIAFPNNGSQNFSANNVTLSAGLSNPALGSVEQISCEEKFFDPTPKEAKELFSQEIYYSNGQLAILNADGADNYTIYDAIGNVVCKGKMKNTINISNLRHGLYIIKLMQGNTIILSAKFVR